MSYCTSYSVGFAFPSKPKNHRTREITQATELPLLHLWPAKQQVSNRRDQKYPTLHVYHTPQHFTQSPETCSKNKGHSMQQSINTPAFTNTNAEKICRSISRNRQKSPQIFTCPQLICPGRTG